MFGFNIWDLFGIISIIFLVASFFIGKNAIWGGFTLGIFICLIVGLINLFLGNPFFNWFLFKKIVTVFCLAGILFEKIGRATKKAPTEKEASIIMENLAKAKVEFEMIQSENIPPDNPHYKNAKRKYERADLKFRNLLKSKK